MSFISSFFKKELPKDDEPLVRFGRYSDAYKQNEQYDLWDKSLELFEKGNYLSAYRAFLSYLYDPNEDNITIEESPSGIHFELIQGSKKIVGDINRKKVRIEAKIVKMKQSSVELLQELICDNYNFEYCRFGISPDHNICILFDTFTIDGSPYKLYYALKELATVADKQDDLLLDKYDHLETTSNDLEFHIPEDHKEVKYKYIIQEIENTLGYLDQSDNPLKEYTGGQAYILLFLSYKLDYLVKPEGFMMESLEKVNRIFFNKDIEGVDQKIVDMKQQFRFLSQRTKEDFQKEMYWVKSTFGITTPVSHDRIKAFIEGELPHMDWYLENDFPDVAVAIPGYILGYICFNYAPPIPDLEFMHLLFKIIENQYYKNLGFSFEYYDSSTDKFNARNIRKAINGIEDKYEEKYPNLDANTNLLVYNSLPHFLKSYFVMISDLNLVYQH